MLKNESCPNGVLTIPLCRGGRDEATGENGVKIGRRKTAARAGEETAQSACHVSASQQPRQRQSTDTSAKVSRHFSDGQQTHHRPVSRHVSKMGPTCHIISREPSQIGAEPSREPRDRIQCSGSYVQPDLRLNMGCSSGQNCFDQILAV